MHGTVFPEKRARLRGEKARTIDVEGIENRVHREAHNLAAAGHVADEALISSFHSSQINDLAVFPKDGTKFPPAREQCINFTVLGFSCYQSVRTVPESLAANASGERAQIGQDALLPFECMSHDTVRVGCKTMAR